MAEENNGNTRRASSEERKKLLRSKRQVSFQQGNDLIPLDLITKEEADSLHKSMHQPDGRPRKISIAHTKSKKKHHVSPSLDPREIRHFVSEIARFRHRQCCCYVKNANSKTSLCQCGRGVNWHEKNNIAVDTSEKPRRPWTSAANSQPVPGGSTTFGFINFHGFGQEASKSAPYVCVDYKTPLGYVWELLSDYWCMPRPKLIISVTGGAKKFLLRDKLKNSFKRGLVNASTTTNAWIVTGGSGAGVMEFVGEAVKEYVLATGGSGKKVVVLGIAAWGNVNNKQPLIGKETKGKFPAMYKAQESTGSGAPLDHNHTHFILVDDGTEGKYGGEIEFRTDLERYISDNCILENSACGKFEEILDYGENVPVVTLMLEGGPNTIKTVLEGIKRNTPVVVIQGSGRAADLIAEAFHVKENKSKETFEEFWEDFSDKLAAAFNWKIESDEPNPRIESCKYDIAQLLEHTNLITVFALESGDARNEIDHAILNALLKANISNVKTQLNLSLAWNRCDVAQTEVFKKENRSQLQNVDLTEAMLTALVEDQPDFVQLFLDNGVDLKQFLTVRRLRDLYHNVVMSKGADASDQLLRHLILHVQTSWHSYFRCSRDARSMQDVRKPKPGLLEDVGNVVRYLLRDRQENIYKDSKCVVEDVTTPLSATSGGMSFEISAEDLRDKESSDFDNPERELFIWAILLNRKDMALIFWKAGVDHIGAALTACAMLKSLSESADEQEELDLSQDLMTNADYFEDVAVGVLNECYLQDRGMAHKLLVRELGTWGKTTLLGIANSSEVMNFMGHTPCQHMLNKIWRGKMALYTSPLKILANLFLPFVVFFIKFSTGEKWSKQQNKRPIRLSVDHPSFLHQDSIRSSLYEAPLQEDVHGDLENSQPFYKVAFCGNKNQNTIPLTKAIYYYHTAPIVKFCYHTIAQLVYLCIFSYFVLCDLHPMSEPNSPSALEVAIWVWTGTLVVEEMRQFWTMEAKSLHYKLLGYLGSAWNVLDIFLHCFFGTSIVLRFLLNDDDFYWARTSYCITLALYFIRFMQVFYVSKNIGPKVIMIRQMLTDLMFFLCILVVFLLAFGVSAQALRYPNSNRSWLILRDVVYMPYWQMYGELFLEDLEGDIGECSSNHTEWELNPDVTRCPEQSKLVVAMLALYMILTNVLLLNLLIAMFSHTFQQVQDNSEKVWRFYKYGLIHEYFDRPTLAPPLIILNHLWRVFKYIRRRCTSNPKTSNDFKVVYGEDDPEANQLTIFERAAMERHLFHKRTSQDELINVQMTSAKDRIEKVIEELDEIKDKVAYRPDSSGMLDWNAGHGVWNMHSATPMPYSAPMSSHHDHHVHHQLANRSSSSTSGFMESRIKHLEERMGKRQKQLEDKMAKQEMQLNRILEILQQQQQQQQ